MANSKSTKRALLTSALAILACAAMLIGTTFAWFTDTASTAVNKIVSGKLDVALEMKNPAYDPADASSKEWISAEGKTLSFLQMQDGEQVQNADILWEPGATYELPQLRIVNNGNLALKYKVVITGAKDANPNNGVNDLMLLDVIDWTYSVVGAGGDDVAELGTERHLVAKTGDTEVFDTLTIKGQMQTTAGNEYQDLSIDGIAITVVATQDTVEYDSKDNQYDADATYPVRVDGDIKTDADTVLKDKHEDHFVQVTIPAGSVDGAEKVSLVVVESAAPSAVTVATTESSQSYEVTLKDQDNNTVQASGEHLFEVELFIGKNRTGVKLYHDGVEMTKDSPSLTETADHFVYDSATGYVTMKVSHFSPFTAVFAKDSWGNNTKEDYDTPVDKDAKLVTIASAEELALLAKQVNAGTSYQGYTVKLTADIDLQENMWVPIGKSGSTFQGVFDGDGHTISNLLFNNSRMSDVGLFGLTTNGEIKNFTLHNAQVTGYLDVGAVAGTPYTSKYTNIKLTGKVQVNGYAYVGGMLGKNAYANLTDLTINVADGSYVKANSQNYRTYVGGLVGFMGEGKQVVKNVTSNIDVIGSTCDVGGITGIAHYGNTFINCHSSGDVTLLAANDAGDELEIGGIAGVWLNTANETVTLTGCTYTGKLSSTNTTTGAVTEFHYNGLVGSKYSRNSDAGTLIIN